MKKASVAVGGLFRLSAGTLLEKHRAGVAIATVEEDNDNHATLQRAGQFHGSLQGRTARDVSTGKRLIRPWQKNCCTWFGKPLAGDAMRLLRFQVI